jgi:ribonuclease Y
MNGLNSLVAIAIAAVAATVAFAAGYLLQRAQERRRVGDATSRAEVILKDANREADAAMRAAALEAKEEAHRRKEEIDQERRAARREEQAAEKRLADRETAIDRRSNTLDQREQDLQRTEARLLKERERADNLVREHDRLVAEQTTRLEQIGGLSSEAAKAEITRRMIDEARLGVARQVKDLKDSATRDAEREAKKIIALAISRLAGEVSAESTVSVVTLPSDEMKGRIIGREGRNIRAFEHLTGIDVIIDDTPEAVVLSCFDPVRREIGRLALERLIADGRIHPTRIEELVAKAEAEVQGIIRESADQVCLDLGITGVHEEVMKTLGRLRYRTSYGQNSLYHSAAVGYLCGMMAAELGVDESIARRAGLFHDIGKAVDHEVEGPHAEIGMNILRKYGESKVVCEAVGAHHDDAEQMPSVYPVLVQAADAISGARPGARRETLATYVRRLERLEGIAREFPDVSGAFAIQAGREIRVMVDSEKTDDARATLLSMEVAQKIESELEYPGTIKVVVIRETRSVEYAK